MKYTIHYHINMGCDITVEADADHRALMLAEVIFESTPVESFEFIDSKCEGIVERSEK